jgi:hypothetical protein
MGTHFDTEGDGLSFRWRLVRANGQIICVSAQSYGTEDEAMRQVHEMPTWVKVAIDNLTGVYT